MSEAILKSQLQDELDMLVSHSEDIFSVVVGINQPAGEFYWTGAAGTAHAGSPKQMTATSPFFIASITKMYTASATMILEEQGQLSLRDPLSRFLPESLLAGLHRYKGQDYSDQLKIYHLISQTSGLPDYFEDAPKGGRSLLDRIVEDGDQGWDLDEVIRVSKEDLNPKFQPAEMDGGASQKKASYSDTNFQLLGSVIEAAAGKKLQEVFSELILDPLELNFTYLYGLGSPTSTSDPEPATIYHKMTPSHLDQAMKSFGPDGGMVSTLDDCLKFAGNFFAGNLFTDPETLDRMQVWSSLFFPYQYGLGLMRFKLPWILSPFSRTPELVGHLGASNAFLMRSDIGPLYITGTFNQLENQRRSTQWMLKIIQKVNKALS